MFECYVMNVMLYMYIAPGVYYSGLGANELKGTNIFQNH